MTPTSMNCFSLSTTCSMLPFKIVRDLRAGGGSQLDGEAAGEFDFVRIAAGFLGLGADVFVSGGQFFRCDSDKVGKPGVAKLTGPALRVFAFAADPDRQARLLIGLRIKGDVVDVVVLAVKA